MNLAVDVHYRDDGRAVAAGILFADWRSDRIEARELVTIDRVMPYRPGRFFERELPCIMALIERLPEKPAIIVVDGYVTLGPERRDGLGAHLFRALGSATPVIGVAKNSFAGNPPELAICRGSSARPLYVTSIGMDEARARDLVRGMHGAHRIPTLLRAADAASRSSPA